MHSNRCKKHNIPIRAMLWQERKCPIPVKAPSEIEIPHNKSLNDPYVSSKNIKTICVPRHNTDEKNGPEYESKDSMAVT